MSGSIGMSTVIARTTETVMTFDGRIVNAILVNVPMPAKRSPAAWPCHACVNERSSTIPAIGNTG